jgi:dynein assembly factor 1
MERLDRLAGYFAEKERKRLNEVVKANPLALPEMSLEEIRLSCLENNGYETPELNDKLYLHFRGFKQIANLDAYTGCKALWLDSNGLEVIENLDNLKELRCLYLSKNLINTIQGLDSLQQLVLLDLSNNRVTKIDGLASSCPLLQTLDSVESIYEGWK